MAKKEYRRGKNEGTIYFSESKRLWVAQVTTGYNPKTGRPKRPTFYGKTRGEVAQKMTKALHEVQIGSYIDPSNVTVRQWFTDWINGRKPFLDENTFPNQKGYVENHIIPGLGGEKKLKDLRTRDIQEFINELITSGRLDGKGGLDPDTVIKIYQVVNMGLEKAILEQIIPRSLTGRKLIELPKAKKKEMLTLTRDELNKLLKTVENYPLFLAYLIESVSGLRRGELLGLKWQNVDYQNNIINIRQQLSQRGKIKGLKTESSMRSISIHPRILELLKAHKTKQNEIKLLLGGSIENGGAYHDNDLIFCKENGEKLAQRTFYWQFKQILKKAGLNENLRFHDLRHTFVTLGLEDEINYKTLQKMTGHASIKTFFDVYGHVTERMQTEAAERIGNRVIKLTCSKIAAK